MRIALFSTFSLPYPLPYKNQILLAPLQVAGALGEGLYKRGYEKGHKITMFFSKDSRLRAPHQSFNLYSLYFWQKRGKKYDEKTASYYDHLSLAKVYQQAKKKKFDIIHLHLLHLVRPFYFAPLVDIPTVITVHDNLFINRKRELSNDFLNVRNCFYISISYAQRKGQPNLKFFANVYNGINSQIFKFRAKPKGNYAVVIGRIDPVKGIHLAVKIALKSNTPLKIIGPLYANLPHINKYWQKEIKPYLGKKIQYLGVLPPQKIARLLQNASCLLFPITWEEPFGLVMAEALACGTPVIAFNRGSVPEIIEDGRTGFIVNNVEEAVRAIKKIKSLERKNCRKRAEERFSQEKMVENYERVYQRILKRRR